MSKRVDYLSYNCLGSLPRRSGRDHTTAALPPLKETLAFCNEEHQYPI
jgi:hypothetical protein